MAHATGAVLTALLCLGVCAGCATGPPPGPTPVGDHTARLQGLHDGIAKEIEGLVELARPLPGRVAVLGKLTPDVSPAELQPDLVRAGLQGCFTAPGQGPCSAPAVVALLDWSAGTGGPLHKLVEGKLAEVSFLRSALAIVMQRATAVLQRMAEARVEAERVVNEAWTTLDRTETNPLESSRVKDASAAEFKRLMALRDRLDVLAKRVETEVRPLSDTALALHQQVAMTIGEFGDVPGVPLAPGAPAGPGVVPTP